MHYVYINSHLHYRQRKEGDEADELLLLLHRLLARVKAGHGEGSHQKVSHIVAYS